MIGTTRCRLGLALLLATTSAGSAVAIARPAQARGYSGGGGGSSTSRIVSPSVVADRYVQLTPAYTSGPQIANGAVIPAADRELMTALVTPRSANDSVDMHNSLAAQWVRERFGRLWLTRTALRRDPRKLPRGRRRRPLIPT